MAETRFNQDGIEVTPPELADVLALLGIPRETDLATIRAQALRYLEELPEPDIDVLLRAGVLPAAT